MPVGSGLGLAVMSDAPSHGSVLLGRNGAGRTRFASAASLDRGPFSPNLRPYRGPHDGAAASRAASSACFQSHRSSFVSTLSLSLGLLLFSVAPARPWPRSRRDDGQAWRQALPRSPMSSPVPASRACARVLLPNSPSKPSRTRKSTPSRLAGGALGGLKPRPSCGPRTAGAASPSKDTGASVTGAALRVLRKYRWAALCCSLARADFLAADFLACRCT